MIKYLTKIHPPMIYSSCSLGGFFMHSGSDGLKDKAVAGKPSVTRLTQSN